MGVADVAAFKDAMLCHCANRNDVWSREVVVRVSSMRDTTLKKDT